MAVTDNDMLNNQSFPEGQSNRLKILMILEELDKFKGRAEIARINAGTDTAYQYWGGYRMGIIDAINVIKYKFNEINQ